MILERHGVPMILKGFIGSMAWCYDGARLQIVWVDLDDEGFVQRGMKFRRKQLVSYQQIRRAATKRVDRARARKRRQRGHRSIQEGSQATP